MAHANNRKSRIEIEAEKDHVKWDEGSINRKSLIEQIDYWGWHMHHPLLLSLSIIYLCLSRSHYFVVSPALLAV